MNGTGIRADIAEQPEAIERALAANGDSLASARAILSSASLIRVVAMGSSRHAGGYAATCLEALGGWPAAVADAPGGGVPRPAWRSGDALLALSQSGRTPALLEAVAAARERGVAVVAIVNEEGGPLAGLADVTLACSAGRERVVAATKTVTTQMALARAVARPISAGELKELLASLDAAMAASTEMATRSPLPSAVVAGGFAGGWLADEVAIKLAEIAGHSAAAEPLVEHLHGPVAAQVPVLALVDGDDPNLAQLPRRDAVRVGTDALADVIVRSTGDPSLDVVPRLVTAQRLVVAWAEHAGEDPDAPRGLDKVTATR